SRNTADQVAPYSRKPNRIPTSPSNDRVYETEIPPHLLIPLIGMTAAGVKGGENARRQWEKFQRFVKRDLSTARLCLKLGHEHFLALPGTCGYSVRHARGHPNIVAN